MSCALHVHRLPWYWPTRLGRCALGDLAEALASHRRRCRRGVPAAYAPAWRACVSISGGVSSYCTAHCRFALSSMSSTSVAVALFAVSVASLSSRCRRSARGAFGPSSTLVARTSRRHSVASGRMPEHGPPGLRATPNALVPLAFRRVSISCRFRSLLFARRPIHLDLPQGSRWIF